MAKRKELEANLQTQERTVGPAQARLVELMGEVEKQTMEAKAARGVSKKVQARLAKAEHEVSMLEIQKLELEQAAVMHEGMMRERELALSKVELQVQLRDRAMAMLCSAFRKQVRKEPEESGVMD